MLNAHRFEPVCDVLLATIQQPGGEFRPPRRVIRYDSYLVPARVMAAEAPLEHCEHTTFQRTTIPPQ